MRIFGYRETGVTTMGQYVADGWGYSLSQDGGEELTLTCKAADLTEQQKEKGSEHFDNQTLGSILKKTFGRVGTQIYVDPQLAGIQIEYLVRHDQSSLDFATRLADQYNALFKYGGGKGPMRALGSVELHFELITAEHAYIMEE